MTRLSKKEALRLCKVTENIETIIELTKHEDAQVRQKAIREMCPCRVKGDINDFWRRLLDPELLNDPAANVREQVLHDLCDGTPKHLEFGVAEALEHFNRDSDREIRRKAHKALTAYNRTGKWNVL